MSTRLRSQIRAVMVAHEITQQQLSTELGISQAALNQIINRDNRPKPETLKNLCAAIAKISRSEAVHLLVEHLRDEIDRSGMLQSDIIISATESPAINADKDRILSALSHAMDYSADVYNLCNDLSTVLIEIDNASQRTDHQKLMAAEPETPYKTNKKPPE